MLVRSHAAIAALLAASGMVACTPGGSEPAATPPGSPRPAATSGAVGVVATTLPGTGLRFDYPEDWRIVRQGPGFWVLANFALRGDETDEELSPGEAKIDVAVEQTNPEVRTRGDLEELYCAEGLDTEVLECETGERIGGIEWLWALTRTETFQPTKMRVAATIAGGKVYTAFGFVPEGSTESDLLATVERILRSMRIG